MENNVIIIIQPARYIMTVCFRFYDPFITSLSAGKTVRCFQSPAEVVWRYKLFLDVAMQQGNILCMLSNYFIGGETATQCRTLTLQSDLNRWFCHCCVALHVEYKK